MSHSTTIGIRLQTAFCFFFLEGHAEPVLSEAEGLWPNLPSCAGLLPRSISGPDRALYPTAGLQCVVPPVSPPTPTPSSEISNPEIHNSSFLIRKPVVGRAARLPSSP